MISGSSSFGGATSSSVSLGAPAESFGIKRRRLSPTSAQGADPAHAEAVRRQNLLKSLGRAVGSQGRLAPRLFSAKTLKEFKRDFLKEILKGPNMKNVLFVPFLVGYSHISFGTYDFASP